MRTAVIVSLLASCLALASCSRDEKPSEGQVIQPARKAPEPTAKQKREAPPTPQNAPAEVQRFKEWTDRTAPLLVKNPTQVVKPSDVECYTKPDDPARGLCMADLEVHSQDSSTYSINWAKKDPSAFKVSTIFPTMSTSVFCGHLGGTRLSHAEKPIPPGSYEERCVLGQERQGYIERLGASLRIHILSNAYLKHDPELQQ